MGPSCSWRSRQNANIGGSREIVLPANSRKDYPLDALFRIKGYGLLGLRAGVEAADDDWKVFVWGKNVTDKYYDTNVQIAYDAIVRLAGMPVTYGLTLAVKVR